MEDQQRTQLTQYIQQAYQSGASLDAIRSQLIASGWRTEILEPVLTQFQATIKPADPHKVRKAIFWIAGPYVVILLVAVLEFVVRFIGSQRDDMGVISIFRIVINIFAIIIGVVAVPMMIVGPIVGIVKLTKK